MDYDVIVIGGGPAGMMAAGTAAARGKSVLLIEKNPRPGKKLMLSGGGRCNLANMEPDVRALAGRFHNGRFLYPAFTALGPKETVLFFRRIGLPTVEESGGRVFPATGRAFDVLRALEDWMRGLRVKVMNRAEVLGLEAGKGEVAGVRLSTGLLAAGSYILCTGGKSYPGTGSTGDGYSFARSLGHTIKPLVPALVPLTVKEGWLKEAEGASLPDASLTIMAGGKKHGSWRGELVFTARGISGPAVLNASGTVCGLAAREEVTLSVDQYPAMPYAELDAALMEYITANQNRRMKNCLAGFVPPKLTPVVLSIAGVDGYMQGNRLSKKMRQTLARTIKGLRITVRGPGGFEKAMVTRGGVDTDEVDPKTMRSRLLTNLFFAGEVLDIDGESGGYNLQACWSTGYLAGKNA